MTIRATILAIACTASFAAHAFADTPKVVNVQPGELSEALEILARQCGVYVIYPSHQLKGMRTQGVSGTLEPRAAFQKLIDGTPLALKEDSSGAILIALPAPTAPKATSADSHSMSGDGTQARGKGEETRGFWSRFRLAQAEASSAPEGEGGREGQRAGEAERASRKTAVQVEEIVVTGTRVRSASPAAPVHTVTRDDIDQSGQGQIGDLVRSLPEVYAGGQNPHVMTASGQQTNQNLSNQSTVNLRGLGSDATLVLLNGRRLAADSLWGADISGIPLAAIERLEILLDGSSALYGSDAVAGVANFILRRDFDGIETSARIAGTTRGGGLEQTYSVLGGIARPDWYLMSGVEYSNQEGVEASDRSFTAAAIPDMYLYQPQERTSLLLAGAFDMSDRTTIAFDLLASQRSSDNRSQSRPTATRFVGRTETPAYSASVSIDRRIGDDWNSRLVGVVAGSESEKREDQSGRARHVGYTNELRYLEFVADGNLFSLPSGEVGVAFGGGYRGEEYHRRSTTGVLPNDAERNISYLFGEVNLPIVQPSRNRVGLNELEVNFAGRFEDYSDFGTTTNPKLGIRYVPFEGLAIRGTWGRSFKAPSFFQQVQEFTAFLHPASLIGESGTVMRGNGGNPNLAPERSTSWTIGADLRPAERLRFSATYFSIDYTDRVVQPLGNWPGTYRDPVFDDFIYYHPLPELQAAYIASADAFTNNSGAPYDPSTVVALFEGRYMNAAAQTVEGVDFSYRQWFDLGANVVTTFANASWQEMRQQLLRTLPSIQQSGKVAYPAGLRARAGLTVERGGFTASGIVNYVSGITDTGVTPDEDVASWTTVDANLGYRFAAESGPLAGVQLALSATNVFDREPPFVRSIGLVVQGIDYDGGVHNALGRVLAVRATKRW